ncbi:MAG: glycosyltransferase family 4 protein [Nitrospinaceae bacterium]|nr:glycosyltransferase family 4 protein [Nitrospinaceae bacterium]
MWFFFAQLKRKPKVLNTHGSLLGYKKYLASNQHSPYKLYDALTFKTSAKVADAVVVSSKLEYEDAIEFGIKKNKLFVIPMGIDVDEYVDSQINHEGTINILFVGRIARVRRIEILLQAVARLSIPCQLILVGGEEKTSSLSKSGYLDELKNLCKALNINDQVTFVGPVPQDELFNWYSKGDIFVYPSLYENFGQPILEAAAAGLPIISTSVGVARELITDNETGFLFTGDVQELADRITQLSDQNIRKEMGKSLRQKARSLYGWKGIIKQYLDLYYSL